MGLLDSIQNSFVGTALDYLGGAFTHPIQFITNPTGAKDAYVAAENSGISGKISNAVKVLGTTATAAATLIGGGTLLGSTSAKAIGSSAITTVVKPLATAAAANPFKAAATTIAGLIGLGAVTSSNKVATAVINTPSSLVHYGSNIGNFVQNPSLKSAGQIFKDNPFLASATVLGAGLAAGTTLNTVATALNTRATNKNTTVPSGNDTNATQAQPINITNQIPTSPTPASPTKTKSKTTKKKAKAKKKTTKKKAKKKTIKRRKSTKKHGKLGKK